MNKLIFVLGILFIGITMLSGNILIDVYHHDYGMADRVVLVFDSKPDYTLYKQKDRILVEIPNCRKEIDLKGKILEEENKVLSAFQYSESPKMLEVYLLVNLQYQQQRGYEYTFTTFELRDNFFKLVFDVYATTVPQSQAEINSFVNFFEKVGKPDKAAQYGKLQPGTPIPEAVTRIVEPPKREKPAPQVEPKPEREIVTRQPTRGYEQEESSEVTEQKSPEQLQQEFQQEFQQRSMQAAKTFNMLVLFYLLGNILVVVVYFVIKKYKSKAEAPALEEEQPEEPSDHYSLTGFGDEKFQKEMVKKLVREKWTPEHIARELDLSEERVNQLIMPQFDDHDLNL